MMPGVRYLAILMVAVVGACGSGSDESATPSERACDRITHADVDRDGMRESEKAEAELAFWRDVWKDAQDAEPDVKEPARYLLDAAADMADGRSTDDLETQSQIRSLASACMTVIEAAARKT